MKTSLKALLAILFLFSMPLSSLAQTQDLDPENTLYLDLEYGRVVIKMFPDVAPNHVKRIKELTRQGYYDGSPFHRVIEGFMAQTGKPGDGSGDGTGQELDAEFSDMSHYRGMVSMARPDDINGADSQFFICLGFSPDLDGKYTIWGEVVSGMRNVDKIKYGEGPGFTDPDKIIKMQVAADVKE
ncbi:MAG TPA: peptidylprolyl isomerase [Emcibacteraceae bacterium]|nr:peptidylprolyl isomerase [Emcibacteraceae bacterium]